MIASAQAAQATLERAGHDLPIADIQAILGDYEKRLYGELGARETADVSYQEIAQKAVADFQHDRGRPGTEVDRGHATRRPGGFDLGVDSTQEIGTLERFNLYVGHNISERGLYFANALGGLPAPSIAVARADIGFHTFGEITLLADRKAHTFEADAYTARQPRGEYEIDRKQWQRMLDSLGDTYGLTEPDRDHATESLSEFARSPALKPAYLREIGKDPKPMEAKQDPECGRQVAHLPVHPVQDPGITGDHRRAQPWPWVPMRLLAKLKSGEESDRARWPSAMRGILGAWAGCCIIQQYSSRLRTEGNPMRDATKRRLEKLETTRAPVQLREVVIVGVECRHDPDGTVWSRKASRYYPRTGVREKLDEPWEVSRRGAP